MPAEDRDLDLPDQIQRIALEWPCYGWRRVREELRRRGWAVNHKRVRRIMREDNPRCLRRRKFVVTTDSKHSQPVYANLAGEMTLTGIDQLWVADITYIRLETEFVYLAVVLDAYSRRVIEWALERTLKDDLAIAGAGLGPSLRPRHSVGLGRLHRPAQGARRADQHEPQGEPIRQRDMRVVHEDVENEEVYRQEYRDLAEARASIERFLEKVYNQQRLHSTLGYRPSVEFERTRPLPRRRREREGADALSEA